MSSMNISDLVKDWGGFEKLVAKLHETGEVTVEHNVVLVGRSGAPRQIDVLIRHKQGLYEHLVVAECKYWNSPVERLHVDALATTVREVGASRGVIFTTKGFQEGAVTQAAHDNIDLFVVRDLTPEEWGLPGRFFDMFLHLCSVALGNVQFHDAFLCQSTAGSTTSHLDIQIGDHLTGSHTPIVGEGHTDKTLEEMICHVATESAQKNFKPTVVQFEDGFNGEMRFRRCVNICPPTPISASLNGGIIFIPRITFDIGVTISQSRIQIDRANYFAFALAVEDCVRRTVMAASRRTEKDTTELTSLGVVEPTIPEDVYQNGSIMTVWIKGFQPFDDFTDLEPGKIFFSKPTASGTKQE